MSTTSELETELSQLIPDESREYALSVLLDGEDGEEEDELREASLICLIDLGELDEPSVEMQGPLLPCTTDWTCSPSEYRSNQKTVNVRRSSKIRSSATQSSRSRSRSCS